MSLRGQSTLRRMENHSHVSVVASRSSSATMDCQIVDDASREKSEHRCIYHLAPISKPTIGDMGELLSDLEHRSLVQRVLSVGTKNIDWIGPDVHTHSPSPDAGIIAGNRPTVYLIPTSQ